jgi:hypothetical protein
MGSSKSQPITKKDVSKVTEAPILTSESSSNNKFPTPTGHEYDAINKIASEPDGVFVALPFDSLDISVLLAQGEADAPSRIPLGNCKVISMDVLYISLPFSTS